MEYRTLLALLALSSTTFVLGCASADDEPSEIVEFVRDKVIADVLEIVPADGSEPTGEQVSSLQRYLCRRPNFAVGVYSLRSFEGHLCQSDYVDGLQMVGGAALLICHEDDYQGFQGSPCAQNALEEYGVDDFDRDDVVDGMSQQAISLSERYATSSNLSYEVARQLFCVLPAAMFGPASSVHDDFCAP